MVEASRKNILFSIKHLLWVKMKTPYIYLDEKITRFWHPHSSEPLHEVKIHDLLKSLLSYLEWTGQLIQKPVLNRMLEFRVFHLTGTGKWHCLFKKINYLIGSRNIRLVGQRNGRK
jgi:hypothetical protein